MTDQIKEPTGKYLLCSPIYTSDHKEISISLEARHVSRLSQHDIYLTGVRSILEEHAKAKNTPMEAV